VGITLLKHEPSAQIPWQNTMLGLVCIDFAVIVILLIFPFSLFTRISFCKPRSFVRHKARYNGFRMGLMQLVCQRNSLNLRSFTVQEIAELSEILTVQKMQWH